MGRVRAAASAPGKVILFGEHFVVKGSRSLAAAISLRVRVTIADGGGKITVVSPSIGLEARIDPETLEPSDQRLLPLARMLAFLKDEYGYSIVPHEALVESQLPVGAGLGSSASFAVAYALAYTAFHGSPLDRRRLVRAGFEAEKVAHGKPSGVDNTIAFEGGGIVYRRGEPPVKVEIRLPPETSLIVVDTGIPRSTREVVESVLARAESTWRASTHIYKAADEIVDLALEAFRRGDARLLGTLMDLNQGLLNAMGASSLAIERIVHEARAAGALGAKLTGAGRGGSVIILAPRGRVWDIVARLNPLAKSIHEVTLGGEGARLEEH